MQTAKTIVVCNQKGGVGKTVTSMCLGVTLGKQGAKVLLCDFDAQGNLTKGLGFADRQKYQYSIKNAMLDTVNEDVGSWNDWHEYILPTDEGVDLLPANISLAGTDLQIASVMSRETIFKRFLSEPKGYYDYIIIDSNPALNLFTINALTAADSVIIPVQAEPYEKARRFSQPVSLLPVSAAPAYRLKAAAETDAGAGAKRCKMCVGICSGFTNASG